MKFITFFEGVFFGLFYSSFPLLCSDSLKISFYGPHLQLPSGHLEYRVIFTSLLGFLIYWYYSVSGFRTRYILWHLERRRTGSGFSPVESACVMLYHAGFLFPLSEFFLFLLHTQGPFSFSFLWLFSLHTRMVTVALFSLLQHIFLEQSGFADRIRSDYFNQDRD